MSKHAPPPPKTQGDAQRAAPSKRQAKGFLPGDGKDPGQAKADALQAAVQRKQQQSTHREPNTGKYKVPAQPDGPTAIDEEIGLSPDDGA
jgi:hypothetical protein